MKNKIKRIETTAFETTQPGYGAEKKGKKPVQAL